MSNMLQDGVAWLAGQLKANASVAAYYVRGTQALSLTPTLGYQLLRTTDSKTGNVKTERTERDFIIPAADLTPDNGVTLWLPQRGDYWLLDLNDGNGMQRYDLQPYGHDSFWRYADQFQVMIRTHTKAMGPWKVPSNFAGTEVNFAGNEDEFSGGL